MFIEHLTRWASLSISRTTSGSTAPLGYGKFGEQTMLKVRIQTHLRVTPHARLWNLCRWVYYRQCGYLQSHQSRRTSGGYDAPPRLQARWKVLQLANLKIYEAITDG